MQLPEDPSVLVLLVATDGARWLPETLRGLRAQKHRPLKIVAVDNASRDGSGDLLAKAVGARRVVTLERRVGYGRALAAALKVAAEGGLDADAFLLVHDDTALEPGTIESMVETMKSEGAGIVGAKLVDWEDPDQLQDVGRTTDRYGRQVPRVERGELDQGQYAGVEEVLYASSAAMLIAREVVEQVGLFDARYVVLRDDLDLCWRARMIGYRTVVDTQATARHVRAGERSLRNAPPKNRQRYYTDRNMIATLIKNYSLPRLLLALPVTVLVSLWNALLFLVTGRRRIALQVLEALQWNIVHLPSTVRARVKAQHGRSVDDREIVALMHHGATRLRAQFERTVEAIVGTPDEVREEDLEAEPPKIIDRLRAHPAGIAIIAGVILVLVGARALWGQGDLAGADLAPFPDRSFDLFGEYASGWRGAGYGGAAPATPALFLIGLLTFVSFGSGWLAQRLLLLGLPVVGGFLFARLGRRLGLSVPIRRGAGVLYALSPLMLAAYGAGRLSDLVLFAAAPGLVVSLLRAGSILPRGGWRALGSGIAGLAITAAFAPWALPMVAAGGLVLAAIAVARAKPVLEVGRRTGLMLGGALVLLFPWTLELFKPGSPIGANPDQPGTTMAELVALLPGDVRPVPLVLAFGVAAAGLGGLLIARGPRRLPATVLAIVAGVGLVASWAVARGVPWIAPRPALPLVVTAVSLVALAAIGLEIAVPLLRVRNVGGLHVAVGVLGLLLAVQFGPAVAWIGRGDRPGVVASGELIPSFFEQEASDEGAFRVLWVGGDRARPVVALTGPQGTTIRRFLARHGGDGAEVLDRIVAAIAGRSTEAGGRMLATMGVRYVIVRPDAARNLADAFARQGDLAFSQRFRRATIYRNTIDLPIAAPVAASRWSAASRSDGLAILSVVSGDPQAGEGFTRRSATSYRGAVEEGARRILLAEDHSAGWRATGPGGSVGPDLSFGWATSFPVPDTMGEVSIVWTGQRWHRAAIVVQALLILAFAAWWSQRAARERGER